MICKGANKCFMLFHWNVSHSPLHHLCSSYQLYHLNHHFHHLNKWWALDNPQLSSGANFQNSVQTHQKLCTGRIRQLKNFKSMNGVAATNHLDLVCSAAKQKHFVKKELVMWSNKRKIGSTGYFGPITRMKTFSLPQVSIEDISRYLMEWALLSN